MLVFDKESPDQEFYFHSTAANERDFLKDVIEIWAEVLRRIRQYRKDGTWNRLLFECWFEQRLLIIYPQLRGESPTKKTPRIVVSLDILRETQSILRESDDESKCRDTIALAHVLVCGSIRHSYRKDPALSELKTTLMNNDFTAWTMHDDNVEKMMKFDLIFK